MIGEIKYSIKFKRVIHYNPFVHAITEPIDQHSSLIYQLIFRVYVYQMCSLGKARQQQQGSSGDRKRLSISGECLLIWVCFYCLLLLSSELMKISTLGRVLILSHFPLTTRYIYERNFHSSLILQ